MSDKSLEANSEFLSDVKYPFNLTPNKTQFKKKKEKEKIHYSSCLLSEKQPSKNYYTVFIFQGVNQEKNPLKVSV